MTKQDMYLAGFFYILHIQFRIYKLENWNSIHYFLMIFFHFCIRSQIRAEKQLNP